MVFTANFGAISLLSDWKSQGAATTLVPQLKLDNVFADQCPSLLKVDVEGFELMVMEGAQRTVSKCTPVLYIENNAKCRSKELIHFVTSLGYTCHWIVTPYFSETNYRSREEKLFPETINSINMLCYSRNDAVSVQKAAKRLPDITKIDVSSGRYMLHEYSLSYTGKEGVVLSQEGTVDSCDR